MKPLRGDYFDSRAIDTYKNSKSVYCGVREQVGYPAMHSVDTCAPNSLYSGALPAASNLFWRRWWLNLL